MDYSEKWGRDVDEAVKLALDDLKVSIDEVDVTVLEEPSRGFFGIGSKLALVRVEKKPKEVEIKPEPIVEEPAPVEEEKAQEPVVQAKERSRNRQDKAPRDKKNRKTDDRKEVSLREPDENLEAVEDHPALTFLRDVVNEMGLDVEITAKMGKEALYLDVQGKDSGTIIGKRGQTLDAIQYLVSLVVNKDQSKYVRVVVDAENYRAKREKTLEALAYRLANKVWKSKRSVKLEPMNPYERKVIHATLQNHPHVTTRSEGEDPYRRVIIELK
ncbi:MAG: protein jag [Firmicutes bacterium]|nr:protein jag [Bacillota bacterium]